MFLNNAIHQYIKEQGIQSHAKTGADLVRQGLVSTPLHHARSKTLLLLVDESYHLLVRYKNAFALEEISCSCGQKMPCLHVYAGLYFILETEDSGLTDIAELPGGFLGSLDEKDGQHPEATPLNEYRNLPIKDASSYVEYLNVYKPPFLRNFTSLTFEKIVLKEKNHLENHISEKHYFQEDKPEKIHKVDLRWHQNQFQIKCQTCKEDSFSTCIHQYEILKHQDIKSIILFGQIPDYNNEVDSLAKKLGIAPEKFMFLHEILIEGQRTRAVLVNQQFFNVQRLEKLHREVETGIFGAESTVKKTDPEEVDGSFGNAILWNTGLKDPVITLLRGKLDKSGSEFQTKIEKTENPEFLPEIEKEFWYKIDRFCKENSQDEIGHKVQSWNRFLQQSRVDINVLTHYISTSSMEIPILSKRHLKKFTFSTYPVDALIRVQKDDSFYRVKLWLSIREEILDPKLQSIWLLPYFLIVNQEAYIFKHPELGRLFTLVGWEEILVDTESEDSLKSLLYTLNNIAEIDYPSEMEPEFITMENPRWKIQIKEDGHHLRFLPILEYGDILEVELPVEKTIFSKAGGSALYTIQEEDVEKFSDFFVDQHPAFGSNLFNHGTFFLHYKDYLHENWFLQFFEKCREMGIHVSGQDELENFRMNTYKPSIRMGISSGIDWFDVRVDMQYGDLHVPAKAWMEAMKKNEKYILLSDGSLGMIPEDWFHKLKRLSLVAYEEKGQVKLHSYHFNTVESLFSEIEDNELHLEIKRKISILGDYDFKKVHELPENAKVTLREYQKIGFQWLKSLSELGFGGCLADDMGLGKTIQVLTLLADQKKSHKGTSLIVVPRSLLFNWATEIEKFYPEITYLYYHGLERVLSRKKMFTYDVVISTYDTVTNDIEFLKDQVFNYIILDESQAIKNPESKRYKAMRLLKSANKIAITGTPIENNTFDLYAQFSFVNPGIFGSASQFKTNFAIPIDKENDPESAFMLRKVIHPFLLRRTKSQVASDLPERSEHILYCEMGETQRALYEDFKLKIKSEIDEGVKNVGLNKMRIKVIEGLLRLRQICNSPQLLDPHLPNHMRQSVKIETLLDIIENDMGDHHALIYSQFTSMLALVRAELDKKGIPYAYLDGSTKDRQAAVQYFMDNQEVKLFLISLKAGNTGLNLVKADYVYILDPWWNPAVEAQAIDRTHRIGQDKNVFAYKMICRNTIEEKIVTLQEKKKQLAIDLIVTDEQVFKSLNNEDLLALFN